MHSVASPLEEPIALQMSARIWAGIDAGIDNVVSLAAVDGDERSVRIGQSIREAGWDQVPWVNGDWPAHGSDHLRSVDTSSGTDGVSE